MDGSPLRKLPAELRQAIYEECLTFKPTLTVQFLPPSSFQLLEDSAVIPHLLGITNTCKEIHGESTDLALKLNTLCVDVSKLWNPGPPAGKWFKRLSHAQLSLIRRCEIDNGKWDTTYDTVNSYNNSPMGVAKKITSMFQSYPRVLRKPSVEHSVLLHVQWNDSGLKHFDSRLCSFDPIAVALFIDGNGDRTRAVLRQSVEGRSQVLEEQVRKYAVTRLVEDLPAQKRKVVFDLQKARQCVLNLLGLLEGAMRMDQGVRTMRSNMDVVKAQRELEENDKKATENSSTGS